MMLLHVHVGREGCVIKTIHNTWCKNLHLAQYQFFNQFRALPQMYGLAWGEGIGSTCGMNNPHQCRQFQRYNSRRKLSWLKKIAFMQTSIAGDFFNLFISKPWRCEHKVRTKIKTVGSNWLWKQGFESRYSPKKWSCRNARQIQRTVWQKGRAMEEIQNGKLDGLCSLSLNFM